MNTLLYTIDILSCYFLPPIHSLQTPDSLFVEPWPNGWGAGFRTCWSRVQRRPKAFGSEYHQSLLNLHGVWRCFPEVRTLIDNSSSITEEVSWVNMIILWKTFDQEESILLPQILLNKFELSNELLFFL